MVFSYQERVLAKCAHHVYAGYLREGITNVLQSKEARTFFARFGRVANVPPFVTTCKHGVTNPDVYVSKLKHLN